MDWKYFFNTDLYTIPELAMVVTGSAMWAILYLIMIINIRKHKYVEMPVVVATGNIAWEAMWAWVFYDLIDIGAVFVYFYRAWFFLDCFVFYYVLKYGQKQITNPYIANYYKTIIIGLTVLWAGLIYAFGKSGFDVPLGVNSAYILNLAISVLYIVLFMRQHQSGSFLKSIAWLKMLGSGVITIAFWTMIPEGEIFEHVIGPAVFVIDCYYIWMLYNWKNPQLDPPFEAEEATQ